MESIVGTFHEIVLDTCVKHRTGVIIIRISVRLIERKKTHVDRQKGVIMGTALRLLVSPMWQQRTVPLWILRNLDSGEILYLPSCAAPPPGPLISGPARDSGRARRPLGVQKGDAEQFLAVLLYCCTVDEPQA